MDNSHSQDDGAFVASGATAHDSQMVQPAPAQAYQPPAAQGHYVLDYAPVYINPLEGDQYLIQSYSTYSMQPSFAVPTAHAQADRGNYQGPIVDEKRHGVGECTYADGSHYRGDWVEDLRCGNGLLKWTDGTTHEGGWEKDQKKGPGKLVYPDGEVVQGTWENGRLNGLAKRQVKGQAPQIVIYCDDLLIMNDPTGVTGGDMSSAVVSFIFMVLGYAAVYLGIWLQQWWIFLFAGFSWFIYGGAQLMNPATKYLKAQMSVKDAIANADLAVRAQAKVMLELACHHTLHSDENSDEKVVTYREEQEFKFNQCQDYSPPTSSLNFLSTLALARLSVKPAFTYAPDTAFRYEKQEIAMIKANKNRDKEYDFDKKELLEGFETTQVLVVNQEDGKKSWFTNTTLLCLLDCFMLGWIQRLVLSAKTKVIEYKTYKHLSD